MRTWADEVEDQRRERDREQRRLIECQHGALRRQCEICKRDARIAELESLLRDAVAAFDLPEPMRRERIVRVRLALAKST